MIQYPSFNTLLDAEGAQEIANEIGFRGNFDTDLVQANNNSGGSYAKAEKLFRAALEDNMAERRSDDAMLERTGYGDRYES